MIVMMSFITNAQTWNQKGDSITGTTANEYVGKRVGMSADGNTMVVASQNSIQIYDYITDWTSRGVSLSTSLTTNISLSNDGNCVAMSNTKGRCVIYENINGVWSLLGDTIYTDTITSPSNNRTTVSLKLYNSNYRLAIGSATYNSNKGVVRIYDYDGSTWNKNYEDSGIVADNLGSSVCLNEQGDKLAVTANVYVKVYKNVSNLWSQFGSNITIPSTLSKFVCLNTNSLNQNFLAIALQDSIIIYDYPTSVWKKEITFHVSNVISSISLGSYTNNLSNGVIVLGVGVQSSNQVTLFNTNVNSYMINQTGQWTTTTLNGTTINSSFGNSISLSSNGESLAVGAQNYKNGTLNGSGQVKVYSDIDYNPLSTTINETNKLEKEITFNNPTTGSLKIRLGDNYSNVQARVMNVYGQILSTTNENNTDNINLSINEATGYYFVELTADDSRTIIKVLKM